MANEEVLSKVLVSDTAAVHARGATSACDGATFAVEKTVEGLDHDVIGWILMGGGALSLLIAAISAAGWMSMGKTKMHTERHASDDGQHYVEETRTG